MCQLTYIHDQARYQHRQGGSKHGWHIFGISMRTAVHGASRVSSAISVCSIYQSFTTVLLSKAVARLVRRWTIYHSVLSGEI